MFASIERLRPKVGIAVFVTSKNHPGCVLIGKRKGSAPGRGQYAVPGGHLEFGEEWCDCAERETMEETGLKLVGVRFCTVVNAVEVENNYHYIDIFMHGQVETEFRDEPENTEPNKCEGWLWMTWDELLNTPPDDHFCGLRLLLQQGYNLFATRP